MSAPARPVTELPRHLPVGLARRTMGAVQRLRTNLVFGLVLLLFALILVRLATLQLLSGDDWRAAVQRQSRTVTVAPLRGAIVDRHGRPFALSRPVRHVLAEAGGVIDARKDTLQVAIEDVGRFASILSGLLEGEPTTSEIQEAIFRRRREGTCTSWGTLQVTIRTNVDDPLLVARLDETRLPGLVVRQGDRRDYPNGSWCGHLVGLARADSAWEPLRGREGLEKGLDAFLAGNVIRRKVPVDGRGRPFVTPRHVDAREDADGRTAWLAVDLVIQGYCEQALDRLMAAWNPRGAVAIVLDPANGDVLAVAQRPSFDPTVPKAWAGLDLATQCVVEVGSTWKPVVATHALDLGLVTPTESFSLPPSREFVAGRARRTIRDAHEGDAGEPGTIVEVLARSNNPDCAEIAQRIGRDRLREFLRRVGVNRRLPLVGLPTGRESRGQIPADDALGALGHLDWGFGHSLGMTPMRLAATYCAFARADFRPVTPRLFLAVGGEAMPDLRLGEPLARDPVTKATIRRALAAVVTEGTGRAAVQSPLFDIAGKTGTAKRPEALGKDTYYSCSFVGYAPAQDPRLVCLVLAYEPRLRGEKERPYGGAVAGPAVREILEKSLGEYYGLPTKTAAAPTASLVAPTRTREDAAAAGDLAPRVPLAGEAAR